MMANSTAMIRKEFIDKYKISYNPEYLFAEDYSFWVKCSEYGKITNIPEILLIYREHQESHTTKSKIEQKADVLKLRKNILENFGLKPTDEELLIHNSTSTEKNNYFPFVKNNLEWLKKIKCLIKLILYLVFPH